MRRATSIVAMIVIAIGSLRVDAQSGATAASPVRGAGTRAPQFFSTIQGNALTATNTPLANVTVRLRDARFGRIVDTRVTDQSGLFAFRDVEPGSYVVEVMASDKTSVLAASQLLNVNAGDAVSALVKLPFRLPPFAGLVGNAATPTSAAAVLAEAASSSVLAVATPLQAEPTCSCPNFPCAPGS
jgi:Carboxypeptidase regulatory-like domain